MLAEQSFMNVSISLQALQETFLGFFFFNGKFEVLVSLSSPSTYNKRNLLWFYCEKSQINILNGKWANVSMTWLSSLLTKEVSLRTIWARNEIFSCGHPIQPLRPSPGISSVLVKGEEVSQKSQAKPGHLKSCIWHISDTWCIRRHRDEQDGLEEGNRQGGNPQCGAGINTNHWQQRRSSGTKHERVTKQRAHEWNLSTGGTVKSLSSAARLAFRPNPQPP